VIDEDLVSSTAAESQSPWNAMVRMFHFEINQIKGWTLFFPFFLICMYIPLKQKPLIYGISVRDIKQILLARKCDLKGVVDKDDLYGKLKSSLPAHAPGQQGCVLWRCRWKASYMVAERLARSTRLTKGLLLLFCVYYFSLNKALTRSSL
jgi:hypothetical protein